MYCLRSTPIAVVMALIVLSEFCGTQVLGQTDRPSDPEVQQLRQTLDAWLRSARNLSSEFEIVRVVRLSTGRISEKTYKAKCLVGDSVIRISRFSEGIVEGEKTWFDVRETLLLPSGHTAEWRHPGFPGQISFGVSSRKCDRIRFLAGEHGDALFPLKKIERVISRDGLKVTTSTPQAVTVRVPIGKQNDDGVQEDYIEIVFDRQFGGLPVSMTRVCVLDNPARTFDSGGSMRLTYAVAADGQIVLKSAQEDSRLQQDVEGTLMSTWTYQTFEIGKRPSLDDLRLSLPLQILSEDVDTGRQVTIADTNDATARLLQERFGDLIQFQSRPESMQCVARSFVGQCPDLAGDFARLLPTSRPALARTGSSQWRLGVLAAHGLGIWVIAGYARIKRRTQRK